VIDDGEDDEQDQAVDATWRRAVAIATAQLSSALGCRTLRRS
jgi:hypothetical protein